MYACEFVFNCCTLIVYYVSQSRTPPSGLTTPVVVHHEAVPAFCRCYVLSDRKVAAHSQGGETQPNQGTNDGCRLRVRRKAYSTSSYKRGTFVGLWRDRVANVCLASVN